MEHGLIHFLTGHDPFADRLHSLGLRDTDLFECGERGTPEHLVLSCPWNEGIVGQHRSRIGGNTIPVILRDIDLLADFQQL